MPGREGRRVPRRGGVPALRHLRVPGGPHRGPVPGAGGGPGRRGVRGGNGEAAGPVAGLLERRRGGRARRRGVRAVPDQDRRDLRRVRAAGGRRPHRGDVPGRRAGRLRGRRGRDRRGHGRHAVLRGIRRPGRATRARSPATGSSSRSPTPARPSPEIIIHHAKVAEGSVREGQAARLAVDGAKRRVTQGNHTATHLLQAALRKVLGTHVKQAGSFVGPDKLRFDFTHFEAVPPEALAAVEEEVNGRGVRGPSRPLGAARRTRRRSPRERWPSSGRSTPTSSGW